MYCFNKTFLIIGMLTSMQFFAQNTSFSEKDIHIPSKKDTIHGVMLNPNTAKVPLVILIPGSGPTDRNGNNTMMKNNSLKFLAEGLSKKQIASFRYDKSTFAMSKKKKRQETDILFTDFIDDAIHVVEYFKKKKQFSKIILLGHSQGSLVGMMAAQNDVDAYISIAGAGRTIDAILKEQLFTQAPAWKEDISKTLAILKKGEIDKNYNPLFASIFRESVQPFLISWIKYNPQEEIKKLTIPILIINGTKDLQVPSSDAKLLHSSKPNSELVIIENMNHIFKKALGDRNENIATYSNSDMPIMNKLTISIISFIKKM